MTRWGSVSRGETRCSRPDAVSRRGEPLAWSRFWRFGAGNQSATARFVGSTWRALSSPLWCEPSLKSTATVGSKVEQFGEVQIVAVQRVAAA